MSVSTDAGLYHKVNQTCHDLCTTLQYAVVVCSGFNVAFNNFAVITTVSGCDRELNVNFYSAASLKYHAPDT